MRPVVTVAEMRAADAAAPVPVDVLIARAGRAVAAAAIDLLGGAYGRRVVVVAGRGNNGADGRAAGTYLAARGAHVRIEPAAASRDRSGPADLRAVLAGADLLVDAAYGTGLRGGYEAPDPAGVPVLAVDVPSGLHGDTGEAAPGAVRATRTVTMAALKVGLLVGEGPQRAGPVEVADIGLPVGRPGAHLVDEQDLAWWPAPSRASHKWARAVWVVAGSPGMRGAAELCARAAQRAGAGMVHVGSPGLGAAAHPAAEAVAVTLPAGGWEADVLAELDRFGAVVVGPGLGRDAATRAGVLALVAASPVPVVVDADGLNALAERPGWRAGEHGPGTGCGAVVLTPHDGEFARLAGHPPGPDRLGDVRALAAATGAVVLLKGPTTVVAAPDGEALLVTAGDARLATAGTGDVLAGIIGAFLAAGLPPLRAAALGAFVHGRAARSGYPVGLVAGDLPALLPAVLAPALGAGGDDGPGHRRRSG